MAREPARYVHDTKTCTYCGSSNNCKYAYNNNKKQDQPRYKCLGCGEYFTHSRKGSGRPTGRKYAKTQGKELDHLERECPQCGAGNKDTRFKYHNNGCKDQPRFSCLKCNKKFSMRLITPEGGGVPHLMHTKARTRVPCNNNNNNINNNNTNNNKSTQDASAENGNDDINYFDEGAEMDRELWSIFDDDMAFATPPNENVCPESEEVHPESMQEAELEFECFPHLDNNMDLHTNIVDLYMIVDDPPIGLPCPDWDQMYIATLK